MINGNTLIGPVKRELTCDVIYFYSAVSIQKVKTDDVIIIFFALSKFHSFTLGKLYNFYVIVLKFTQIYSLGYFKPTL